MPQKRNPDAAELICAKTGRVIGDLNTLPIVGEGLPPAGDKQEDKELVFDCADTQPPSVAAMTDTRRGRSSTPGAWPPTRGRDRHGDDSRTGWFAS